MNTKNYQWTNTQKTTGHQTILWHAPDQKVGPWDSKLNPKGQAWTGVGVRESGAIDIFDVKGNGSLFSFKMEPSSGSLMAQNLAKSIGAYVNGNPEESLFSNSLKKTQKGVKLAEKEGFYIEPNKEDIPETVLRNGQTKSLLKTALSTNSKQRQLLETAEKEGLDTLSSKAGFELHNWLAGASHRDAQGRLVTSSKLSEQRHSELTQNPGLSTVLMDIFQNKASETVPSTLEEISHNLVASTHQHESQDFQERAASVVQRVAQSAELSPEQRRTYLRNLDVMTQDHDPLYEAQSIKPQTLNNGHTLSGDALLAETLKLGEHADSFVEDKRFRKSAAMMPAGVLAKTGKEILNSKIENTWKDPQDLAQSVATTLSAPIVQSRCEKDSSYKDALEHSPNLNSDLRTESGRAMVEGLRLDSLPKRLSKIQNKLESNTLEISDIWDRPQDTRQSNHLLVLPKTLKNKAQKHSKKEQEI